MKIILIQFRFTKYGKLYDANEKSKNLNYLFPLGLPYLSAVLKRAGHDVTCLNLNHYEGTTREIIINKMGMSPAYQLAFVGGLSLFYPHLRDLIADIRIASPETKIVCGGGIITAQPEIMMSLLKPDYAITGEGEVSVLKLVAYLEDGVLPETNIISSEPITNLDALPFPDHESFNFSEYVDNISPADYFAFDVVDEPRVYPILASRSCVFGCTFCFHPIGKKYRQRSIDNIMDEIRLNIPKYRINIVTIYDEMFSDDFERMKEFCGKFKAFSDTLPYKLWFICNIRVDKATDEMLKIMRESGAGVISFGLESYSQKVLNSMHKHITPKQIANAITLVRKNGLGLQGNFIFGDPAETLETAKETLTYVHNNRHIIGTAVPLDYVAPFQGSPLYKYCVDSHIIPDEIQLIKDRELTGYPRTPINMTRMPAEDFETMQDMIFAEQMTTPYVFSSVPGTVTCPSCGYISVIPNLVIPKFRPYNAGCRKCHFRFDVVSQWYPYIRKLFVILGRKNTKKLIEWKTRTI